MSQLILDEGDGLDQRTIRRIARWIGWKRFRHIVEMSRAEIQWLRAELQVALATNRRMAEVNAAYEQEIAALREENASYRIVDPSTPCYACGGKQGTLRTIVIAEKKEVRVQRTCGTCGFQQAHAAVRADAIDVFQPTPGEDELKGAY